MQIVRQIVDLAGNPISREPLKVPVSSREEAEEYIKDHSAKVFAHHGYNEEHGYWWGRQDDDDQISNPGTAYMLSGKHEGVLSIYTSIAHQNIQDRRAYTQVPCGPRGWLHDYVPFYFGVRSPMLFTISRGNVEGYDRDQEDVIYLVSTAQ